MKIQKHQCTYAIQILHFAKKNSAAIGDLFSNLQSNLQKMQLQKSCRFDSKLYCVYRLFANHIVFISKKQYLYHTSSLYLVCKFRKINCALIDVNLSYLIWIINCKIDYIVQSIFLSFFCSFLIISVKVNSFIQNQESIWSFHYGIYLLSFVRNKLYFLMRKIMINESFFFCLTCLYF